ncbi:hypothetical protein [Cyanobium sp. ATX 6A2]|uniref:hypothetical protein n=1 Tax=Cyanobium sp. ATX 6A2 TaxID=2823700 RepID=UPI0020CE43F1|nr:hypothetical protein [Cyanobium sp. ATX 6A2]
MAEHGCNPKPAASGRLEFRRATTISARGETLAVELDTNGSSWALAADLLALYEIPYAWEASRRRILIGSLDVVPTFRDDQVQPSVGWRLFEMTLQSGNAPVILLERRAEFRRPSPPAAAHPPG